jgi:hypothetical protein
MEIELWLVERDGTRIAPLHGSLNFDFCEWELNGVGSASLTGNPTSRNVDRIEGVRNEIQIWIDGDCMWWGPVLGLSGGPHSVNVSLQGLFWYFTKRFVHRTSDSYPLLYESIDQIIIAVDLITYAQHENVSFGFNRDLNIDFATIVASGVPRSREYKLDDHGMILDFLKEFDERTLKNGFDWEIDISQGGGSRFWTPHYPKLGTTKPNFSVLWGASGEQRNVATFTWTEDFGDLGTYSMVTGGSVTTDSVTFRKTGEFENTDASEYFGQMQKVISDGAQLDQDWLDDRAEQESLRSSLPNLITEITAARMTNADALKGVVPGDYLPVKIDHGRIQVDALHRVERMRLNADGTLSFGFGEVIEA